MNEEDCIELIPLISNIRLDKYLSEQTELSRNFITNLIETGFCFVNGNTAIKKYKIKSGDQIKLILPPVSEIELLPENIPLDIVFEDKDLLVVNKQRGLVVHPSYGHESGTLVNALLYHCKGDLSGINGKIRPGILHRIDMNTSGLLLVAKNNFAHIILAEQIKEHSILREYNAIVLGNIKEDGIVDAPIGRDKNNRKRMTVTYANSKNAVTHFYVIEGYNNATHIKLRLETGRTHQIRVHMSYLGHPILGDDIYGNGKPKWLGGQCLHSKTIGFIHPRSNQYMEFSSELPDYFNKLISQIRR